MAHPDPFPGFTPATLRLLSGVRRDNSRGWFARRQDAYRRHYVEPGLAFVEAALPRLRRLVPGITADARVGGSLFSLVKDARFAPADRPLREHLEVWFWEGARRDAASAFFLHVTPRAVFIGAGHRRLDGARLEAFRAALRAPDPGAELDRIARRLDRSGMSLEAPDLVRRPRATSGAADCDSPAARFLLQRSLVAEVERGAALATSPELVPRCLDVWRRVRPVHRWLVEHVQGRATTGAHHR